MAGITIDTETASTADMELAFESLQNALQARRVEAQAPILAAAAEREYNERLDGIAQSWHRAQGYDGTPTWRGPEGAHDAYPLGMVVVSVVDDEEYESLIHHNVTKPGDPADPQNYRWWKKLTPEPPDPGDGPPEWSGLGVLYEIDTLVTRNNKTYKARMTHTSQPGWAPGPGLEAIWLAV